MAFKLCAEKKSETCFTQIYINLLVCAPLKKKHLLFKRTVINKGALKCHIKVTSMGDGGEGGVVCQNELSRKSVCGGFLCLTGSTLTLQDP